MDEQATRTILITNFSKDISHSDILRTCKMCGDVKEHFVMNNRHSVFFVSFYDLRSATKAHKSLASNEKHRFVVKYAISLREIPKGSDTCSEEKNQGSVAYSASEEIDPEDSKEVLDISKKGKEITVQFFDSREAIKFLNKIKESNPRAAPRIVWDNDLRKRIKILKESEEIVKNAPGGFFKGVGDEEHPQKRAFLAKEPTEIKKKVKLSVNNWMVAVFDRFIIENADDIANDIK